MTQWKAERETERSWTREKEEVVEGGQGGESDIASPGGEEEEEVDGEGESNQ